MRQYTPDPGNMFNYCNLAGFLTCFTSNAFPSYADSGLWFGLRLLLKLTVAGTVPDLHRIPFYTINEY